MEELEPDPTSLEDPTETSEVPERARGPAPRESERRAPWVQLKYFNYAPTIYPGMIKRVSKDARNGELINVYDKTGHPFGAGLYNRKARVPLRMVYHGPEAFSEADFEPLLERAIDLRLQTLALPEVTDAFRVVHSDGDGLGGLVVDKFGDVLSVEVHSRGVYKRLGDWLPRLHRRLGTSTEVVEMEDWVADVEGIRRKPPSAPAPRPVKILENGLRYEVDFALGHKTGFFCDQRDNRRRLGALTPPGARVLDLCCYTGGFALAAAVHGKAGEVTGVDLDEAAIAMAKRNANLNQVRLNWVHCDAFSYARQMQRNGDQWDVVVLDPPKFVLSRNGLGEGQNKYQDLNRLGVTLVKPGGLLVTCSCSGLVSEADFEHWVIRSAHQKGRRLQVLARTGAGADHPVMSNCPESRYLKVLWARVF
jgi:23S rRNA (cytosine1962-C5)-methyltransferase